MMTRHITSARFRQQIEHVFRHTSVSSNVNVNCLEDPRKVAVCVSGGPDSMLLAYLLKNCYHPSVPDVPLFDPYAIVVDHKARPNSSYEADRVADSLHSLGIKSEILGLDWPQDQNPAKLGHFETLARHRRYQAITSLAIKKNATALFTGHHQDDQIETMLMRLAQIHGFNTASFRLALRGIAPVTSVPCCDHLFDAQQTSSIPVQQVHHTRGSELNRVSNDSISGQLMLYRPLLVFTKKEILATCRLHNIGYVEDATNHDPTLTMRNAVRYLRSNFDIPLALGAKSLLQLRSSACSSFERTVVEAKELAKLIYVVASTAFSSTVTVSFPLELMQKQLHTTPDSVAYAFARIVESISPKPSEEFPVLLHRQTIDRIVTDTSTNLLSFADQQVSFTQSVDSKKPIGYRQWTLHRQPMRLQEQRMNTMTFTSSHSQSDGKQTSNWLLWDNRFWVRVRVPAGVELSDISIRPYVESDSHMVKAYLSSWPKGQEMFHSLMSLTAPGKCRYTLPLLLHRNEIFAFPTLRFSMSEQPLYSFEVRYPCKSRVQEIFLSLALQATKT